MRKMKQYSMKWRLMAVLFLCWLLPILLMMGVISYYILGSGFETKAEGLEEQMVFNGKIAEERLSQAVADSRMASLDGKMEEAYKAYQAGASSDYQFYLDCQDYLLRKYRQNDAFQYVIFWCERNPLTMNNAIYNESTGATYQQVENYWKTDHERVYAYARDLGTEPDFYQAGTRLYLVRNLYSSSFEKIGTLVASLNQDYCFETLFNFQGCNAMTISLNDVELALLGEPLDMGNFGRMGYEQRGHERYQNELYVYHVMRKNSLELYTLTRINKAVLTTEIYGYRYLMAGMLLGLVPLMVLLMWIFRRQISDPVNEMMEGSEEIERGNLGYQIAEEPKSLEFQYLIHSFNQMSRRLKQQFDHIYREELALKDAKIMALQSHINPHFMNNTLEIINWEARLAGNVKVSKMIEALGKLMDAAVDRKKCPEILLAEEMIYVDAYLYISSERLGKRLVIEKDLDPKIMNYRVPRLILQPVIENAIEHGIVPNGRGTVSLRGKREGKFLILEIENDGKMSSTSKNRIAQFLDPGYDISQSKKGNMGIGNVNQRLHILYGAPCGLQIEETWNEHTVARITIAVQKNNKMQ